MADIIKYIDLSGLTQYDGKIKEFVNNKFDSPNFTGIPTAPTAEMGNSSTQLATTQFVELSMDELIMVSEQQPAEELNNKIWINPKGGSTTFVAEINDKITSEEDTWSSAKIEEMIGKGSTEEPQYDDIPQLFIIGARPIYQTLKDINNDNYYSKPAVDVKVIYKSRTDSWETTGTVKRQGDATTTQVKANFALKLAKKKQFKDWPENKSFTLKSGFDDGTHLRHIASARIWTDMVKTREDFDDLPDGYKNSPRLGTIDGFPVRLYYIDDGYEDTHKVNTTKKNNDYYDGIYTLMIKKSEAIAGLDCEANPDVQAMVTTAWVPGQQMSRSFGVPSARNFTAHWDAQYDTSTSRSGMELEAGYTVDENGEVVEGLSPVILQSINEIIDAVKLESDEEFKTRIEQKLDLGSALDFYIMKYTLADDDGNGKNQLMVTYDGVKWYYLAYDMSRAFYWTTQKFPEICRDPYNALFERLWNCYPERIKARYLALRKTALSYPNIVKHVEDIYNLIGSENYTIDKQIFTGIAKQDTPYNLRKTIKARLLYCDEIFNAMAPQKMCLKMTMANIPAQSVGATIDVKNYLTLTPADTTSQLIITLQNNTAGATLEGTTVTFANAGTVDIKVTTDVVIDGYYPLSTSKKVTVA